MARSGMVLGGLLAGIGSGLTMEANNRREEALLKLRRQWQQEDTATAESRTIAAEERGEARDVRTFEREGALKTGLILLSQQHQRLQGETDQQYKERLLEIQQQHELERIGTRGTIESQQIAQRGKIDERLARVRSDLDLRNDAASQKLAREIDRNEVEFVGVSPDGFVIVRDQNRGLITTTTKMASSALGDDDEEGGGGSIAAAQARRSGGGSPTPTPAPAQRTPPRAASGDPTAKQAVERTVAMMVRSGQLAKGTRVGETVTAPAGALGAEPVTVRWDGQKWVYVP